MPEKAVTYTVLFDAVTVNNRMVQAADLILSILLLFIKPIQKTPAVLQNMNCRCFLHPLIQRDIYSFASIILYDIATPALA